MIMMTLIISETSDTVFINATSYHISIFEILIYTFNYGMVESLGIYGSESFGSGKKERLTLLMYQSMFISLCLFFIGLVPFYFISIDILQMYGVSIAVTEQFKSLLLYSLPGIFLKILTDNYKTFIQCQGKYILMGCLCICNILIMYPLSRYIMIDMGLREIGYGLCFGIMGAFNLIFCIYFQYFQIDQRCKILRYRLKFNIGWFFWLWVKNSFTEYHFWIGIEFSVFAVSLIGSGAQIQAQSLLLHIFTALIATAAGFYIFPRTTINNLMGQGLNTRARSSFFVILKYLALVASVIVLIIFIACYIIFKWMVDNSLLSIWVERVLFWYCIKFYLYFMIPILSGMLKMLEKQVFLITVNTIVTIILMPAVIYLLAVKLEFGLLGVALVMIFDAALRIGVYLYALNSNTAWITVNLTK